MTDEETKYPSALDPLVLRELIRQVTATDIDELEVTYGRARIYLRRHPGRQLAGRWKMMRMVARLGWGYRLLLR
jgi:hypothetical protein